MGNPYPNDRQATILMILVSGEKYGREINDAFAHETGKPMPLGSLYVTLDRMEQNGWLKTKQRKSKHPKGGNHRTYFCISGEGQKTLRAYQMNNDLK